MSKIKEILAVLGTPYEIREIDGEDVIYRNLGNGYEFEVSGLRGSGVCTLYVWQITPHRELMGVYSQIPVNDIKDALGHFAYAYRNLEACIRVERES